MKNNIEPCPFCGEIPLSEFDDGLKKYWIHCDNPKCKIQPSTDAHVNKSVVTREWNRRANNIIVLPCKIGEILYLIQVDYKGNYSLNSCEVSSKITMFSILRAYEEKTILFMSTDKKKAEKKIKELEEKSRNGK